MVQKTAHACSLFKKRQGLFDTFTPLTFARKLVWTLREVQSWSSLTTIRQHLSGKRKYWRDSKTLWNVARRCFLYHPCLKRRRRSLNSFDWLNKFCFCIAYLRWLYLFATVERTSEDSNYLGTYGQMSKELTELEKNFSPSYFVKNNDAPDKVVGKWIEFHNKCFDETAKKYRVDFDVSYYGCKPVVNPYIASFAAEAYDMWYPEYVGEDSKGFGDSGSSVRNLENVSILIPF